MSKSNDHHGRAANPASNQAGYTRVPLDPRTLAEVASFVSAQTAGWMTVERTIDVITTITAGADAVMDLELHGRRIAVATLIDTCATQANAAELSLFVDAAAENASTSAGGEPEVLDIILAWAIERLRSSSYKNLDIPIWPGTSLPDTWLSRHSFAKAYDYFEMEREGHERLPPEKPLPEGLAWQSYEDRFFSGLFETARRAFENVPGAFVPSEDAYRERSRRYPIPPALIVDGERVAAFVRVELKEEGAGEIPILGRHPDYRKLGLGEHLVRHGIEMLSDRGAHLQRLEVTAVNTRAVELYERFGFLRRRVYSVYRRPINGPLPLAGNLVYRRRRA